MSDDSEETVKIYNNILKVIDDHLIPDSVAKAARGEVFTPPDLVREMLFGLNKDKLEKGETSIWGLDERGNFIDDDESNRVGGIPTTVWRDPSYKWLDPANGIGNFPVIAFYKLDYELSKHKDYKDKEKRQKHIIENMLYMIELDKGNCATSRQIFKKICAKANPNICCANTLEMTDAKLESSFSQTRFDVVMGNPPFNEGGTKTTGEKGFYKKFISYGFNVLSKRGYLVFVHPPNFHRIDKDDPKRGVLIKKIFDEHNLIFLRIISDTKIYFDVQISIDYYILQNEDNQKGSIILDKHNVLTTGIDISLFKNVPNFGFEIVKKFMTLQEKFGSFNAKVGSDSSHDSRHIIHGEYPIVHLINKDGIRVIYSNKKHSHQNTPKIIINGLGVPYVLDDEKGKYGVSQVPNYVLNPSPKEKIFLFSKLFQYLNWAYRIQGNNNDYYLFDVLPDLNKFSFKNESQMIDELKLTDIEKEAVEKEKIPVFEYKDKIEINNKKNKESY